MPTCIISRLRTLATGQRILIACPIPLAYQPRWPAKAALIGYANVPDQDVTNPGHQKRLLDSGQNKMPVSGVSQLRDLMLSVPSGKIPVEKRLAVIEALKTCW